jgi:HTH-type transcriptional regulator/antitoxin HigA
MRYEIIGEGEYRKALAALRPYFDVEPAAGSVDAEDFDRLFLAIQAYENLHYALTEIAS